MIRLCVGRVPLVMLMFVLLRTTRVLRVLLVPMFGMDSLVLLICLCRMFVFGMLVGRFVLCVSGRWLSPVSRRMCLILFRLRFRRVRLLRRSRRRLALTLCGR